MSQKNNDFFESKKEWSFTKDGILGCYLRPYFQKLIAFGKPICYVDCFAGKGIFDDGNPGSPLIALGCINNSMQSARYETEIFSYFIELNHHQDLQVNIQDYVTNLNNKRIRYDVISGKFEDNIDDILSKHSSSTIFLYVDPYGIKAIDISKFNAFKTNARKSVEMLINFNTWGFFREACRVLKADFKLDQETQQYLVEYDPNNNLSREELSTIAGGDYWIEILTEYKNNCHNATQKEKRSFANEAEYKLSVGIANAFKQKYKYVLNVPIKSSSNSSVPKYRLFHLTNHTDGCILMADNMYKRIEEATEKFRGGQVSLFDFDTEGDIILSDEIEQKVLMTLNISNEHLDEFLCRFFTEHGILKNSSSIKEIIKSLEAKKLVTIEREPKYTKTGKISNFMQENKMQSVYVRSNIL